MRDACSPEGNFSEILEIYMGLKELQEIYISLPSQAQTENTHDQTSRMNSAATLRKKRFNVVVRIEDLLLVVFLHNELFITSEQNLLAPSSSHWKFHPTMIR